MMDRRNFLAKSALAGLAVLGVNTVGQGKQADNGLGPEWIPYKDYVANNLGLVHYEALSASVLDNKLFIEFTRKDKKLCTFKKSVPYHGPSDITINNIFAHKDCVKMRYQHIMEQENKVCAKPYIILVKGNHIENLSYYGTWSGE